MTPCECGMLNWQQINEDQGAATAVWSDSPRQSMPFLDEMHVFSKQNIQVIVLNGHDIIT